MPGYGFSGKPTTTGWDPVHIARAWIVLMKRLGYTRFVAQGGDWGSPVSNEMAKLAPPELLGIHVNLPGVVPRPLARDQSDISIIGPNSSDRLSATVIPRSTILPPIQRRTITLAITPPAT